MRRAFPTPVQAQEERVLHTGERRRLGLRLLVGLPAVLYKKLHAIENYLHRYGVPNFK